MEISRRFFPEILLDNDMMYFAHLEGVIESIDELAKLEITWHPKGYHFRIAPSMPRYSELLLKEILRLHNMFHIRLNLSKSIKTSGTISFEIDLDGI